MTLRRKKEIAHKLARTYKDQIDKAELSNPDKIYRDLVIGLLLRTPNQYGTTLVGKFGKPDAMHIANIAINILKFNINEKEVDF